MSSKTHASMTTQEQILLTRPNLIGASQPRVDSTLKVTGRAAYVRDMKLPRMLYAKVKRCPYAHAEILRIDAAKIKNMTGVKAVITGKDFPPMNSEDTPPLAYDEALYQNQGVAAVAAESRLIAEQAADDLEVEYEELPAVFDPELAMTTNTPTIIKHPGELTESPNVAKHLKLRKGDVEAAFAKADHVVEETYRTVGESHLQLEPLTFLAQPDNDGGVTIWATSSGPQKTQIEVANYLNIDPSLVRVNVPFLGGWFGSKEESHVAAVCAMLALKASRPVKLELSREESITASGIRHPAVVHIKDGITDEGKIIARRVRAVYDGGAYGALANAILKNSILGAVDVYDLPNLEMDTYRVYTNRVPGSMKRAPIGLQMIWAIECQNERLAATIGMDPVEFRLKNLLHEGQENAIGEKMDCISHEKALLEVAKAIQWGIKRKSVEGAWRSGKGVALAAKWTPGGPHQSMVKVKASGKIELWAPIVENGQGTLTGMAQLVASEFGIPFEDVVIMPLIHGTESQTTGLSGGASASRQLVNVGKATVLACNEAKKRIAEEASKKLGVPVEDLDVKEKKVFSKSNPTISMKLADLYIKRSLLGSRLSSTTFLRGTEFVGYGTQLKETGNFDPDTGKAVGGRISPYYISVAQSAEVSVNVHTGQVKVIKIAAAHDVGKAINPLLVKHQIIGSVMTGVSGAMSEELEISNGRVNNANLADYKALTAVDAPQIEPIIIETPNPAAGPYGAKGVGEPSTLPTAAAIRNAIHDAVGVWVNALPMTPERVLEALSEKENT